MKRYFVDFKKGDKTVKIVGEDYHHLKNVLRLKINDELYVSNGKIIFYSVIKEIKKEFIEIELLYEVKENSELDIFVTIAQGMPKSGKFELVIQKTTELGVKEIIPVFSERSVVRFDKNKVESKITRYKKIAKASAEQSRRLIIPKINSFMTIKELIDYSKSFTYKCIAYEASNENERNNLSNLLHKIKDNDKILIFIGPEGGVSNKELSLFKDNDFQVISLGKRILRTETAPLFLMSVITYELEVKG